mgnify:CR=1 FL=1
MLEVYCSTQESKLLEEFFKRFLAEEAGRELYIISPWISEVRFERRLVYHPYLDAESSVEALAQLARLSNVYIVTRYYDDVLSPSRILSWQQIYKAYRESPTPTLEELYKEVIEEIKSVLIRIRTLERLSRIDNIHVRFNNRIHAKIYVGERYAIVGSANFTTYALKNYNNECILLISKEENEELFKRIRSYARIYFEEAFKEPECEKTFLRRLKRLGLHFNSLAELRSALERLI